MREPLLSLLPRLVLPLGLLVLFGVALFMILSPALRPEMLNTEESFFFFILLFLPFYFLFYLPLLFFFGTVIRFS